MSDYRFGIIRKNGRVIGFELTATGKTEAECFCYSFPFAQKEGKAGVVIRGTKIIFTHAGFSADMIGKKTLFLDSEGGTLTFEIKKRDARQLNSLLHCKDEYAGFMLRATPIHLWEIGFKMIAEKTLKH